MSMHTPKVDINPLALSMGILPVAPPSRRSRDVGQRVNQKATVSLSINVRERREVIRRSEGTTKRERTLHIVVPAQSVGYRHDGTNHVDPHS
jgi:hypothetical protein